MQYIQISDIDLFRISIDKIRTWAFPCSLAFITNSSQLFLPLDAIHRADYATTCLTVCRSVNRHTVYCVEPLNTVEIHLLPISPIIPPIFFRTKPFRNSGGISMLKEGDKYRFGITNKSLYL